MNLNIYKYSLIALLTSSLLTGCKDEAWNQGVNSPDKDGIGTLNLQEMRIDVSEVEKVVGVDAGSSRDVSAGSYNINTFNVIIEDKDTKTVVKQWTYSSVPEIVTLPEGTYKIKVYSHDVQPAEWEKPYFYVDKDFAIVTGAIERMGTLTAKLSNSAVSVRFDDELRKYCSDDVKVDVVANDQGKLSYTLNETRKGYFQVLEESSTMVVTFSGTVNGYYETVTLPATDLIAAQHRIYTFKAKSNTTPIPDETGTVNPSGIQIDVEVVDEDVNGNITLQEDIIDIKPSDRPGYEEPGEGGDNPGNNPGGDDNPETPVATFTPSKDLSLTGVNNYNDYGEESEKKGVAMLTINCPAGFAHINVEIISDYLTEEFMNGIEFTTKFDLAEPGEYEEMIKSFGFKVKEEVKGKQSVDFDITNLVPLLALGIETGDTTAEEIHEFKITVVDNNNKQISVTLKFNGIGKE